MRVFALLLAVLLVACGDMMPSIGAGGGGSSSSAAATGAGGAASMPCDGFKDVEGGCWAIDCFGGSMCNNATAATVCQMGVDGPGVCVGGFCVWENNKTSCSLNADCPCGLCRADGKCYEDVGGGCGTCKKDMAAATGASNPACDSCMTGCSGTGPSCCKGCGCACEGVCGICH